MVHGIGQRLPKDASRTDCAWMERSYLVHTVEGLLYH